ncbi:FAD-dependent oxidoreductase [Streptomyces sp. NPDC058326]|uniref:FAD-dependent oxidoreductase n=1 Tax=Streptomyces sp. NPDC058326 TaxID=3346447 RepID=UPI0036EBF739
MADHGMRTAVVLGGSMAGLLAARVLAEVYSEVVIVDRDEIQGVRGPRRGVPQGRQIHGLQPAGQRILEELFPGLTEDLAGDGAQIQDTVADGHWYFRGRKLMQSPSDLVTVAASRPLLEYHVRRRVAAFDAVSFLERRDIVGLTTTPDASRVTGVRVRPQEVGSATEEIRADLVVDAMGRGSRTPVWLEELGYPRVQEDRLKVGVGYTTRHYRVPPKDVSDGKAVVVVGSPEQPRGAICARVEGDRIQVTANGMLDDRPAADADGFHAYLLSLAAPPVHQLIRHAEPLDDPVTYRVPVSVRRHYDRMARFPEGFLVTGDSVCAFNPVYAQGMTVAALGAMVLRRCLRSGRPLDPRAFLRDLTRTAVAPSWEANTANDLAFQGVEGRRTWRIRLMQAWGVRIQEAAAVDAEVAHRFIRVLSLVDPGSALLRPSLVWRALRVRRQHGRPPVPRATAPAAGRAER